jgi:hypothetical protein
MNECDKRGCRNLKTVCQDCGRTVTKIEVGSDLEAQKKVNSYLVDRNKCVRKLLALERKKTKYQKEYIEVLLGKDKE